MKWTVMQWLVVASMVVLLAGCGSSRESQAAALCEAAAMERATDKMLVVDRKALAQSARAESDDIIQLQAPVTLDTGLPSEYTQTLTCRVQFSGKEARVVGLVFVF